MKKFLSLCLSLLLCGALFLPAAAADATHTVAKGDTMWKVAVKYQIGVSEIIAANPQITNPNLIYPGQVLTIPGKDTTVEAYEAEVIRLRYGLVDGRCHTLEEVGLRFDVTRERIRQIEAKALRKLRQFTRRSKLNGYTY